MLRKSPLLATAMLLCAAPFADARCPSGRRCYRATPRYYSPYRVYQRPTDVAQAKETPSGPDLKGAAAVADELPADQQRGEEHLVEIPADGSRPIAAANRTESPSAAPAGELPIATAGTNDNNEIERVPFKTVADGDSVGGKNRLDDQARSTVDPAREFPSQQLTAFVAAPPNSDADRSRPVAERRGLEPYPTRYASQRIATRDLEALEWYLISLLRSDVETTR